MGEISKNINQVSTTQLIVPENLKKRKQNFEGAGYTFTYDQKDNDYIEFNTLCEKRPETVTTQIIKIYRVQDRESEDEKIVVFQKRYCKDFTNKTREGPDEVIGLVPKPESDFITNDANQVVDISKVATKNDYYLDYSQSKLEELFQNSIDSHKIVCYVGYQRTTQIKENNFIDNKKIILNQDAFIKESFENLIGGNSNANQKKTYKSPRKVKEVNLDNNSGNGEETSVQNLSELLEKESGGGNKKSSSSSSNKRSGSGGNVDVDKEFKELVAGGK